MLQPMRLSAVPGECPAISSSAEVAIRPWAIPDKPHNPLAAIAGAADEEIKMLPTALAATKPMRRIKLDSASPC